MNLAFAGIWDASAYRPPFTPFNARPVFHREAASTSITILPRVMRLHFYHASVSGPSLAVETRIPVAGLTLGFGGGGGSPKPCGALKISPAGTRFIAFANHWRIGCAIAAGFDFPSAASMAVPNRMWFQDVLRSQSPHTTNRRPRRLRCPSGHACGPPQLKFVPPFARRGSAPKDVIVSNVFERVYCR
jgi:hypothetical protein